MVGENIRVSLAEQEDGALSLTFPGDANFIQFEPMTTNSDTGVALGAKVRRSGSL